MRSGLSVTFVFSVCLISHLYLAAQELPPIMTQPYKAGVYTTYREFVMNAPSIVQGFKIIPRSGAKKIEQGRGDYQLIFLDSLYSSRDQRKIWGVSDGEGVYVNETAYEGHGIGIGEGKSEFRKLLMVGRYSCLYDMIGGTVMMMPTGGSMAMIGGAPSEVVFILNINNGKFYVLSKDLMRQILKQDRVLLAAYEATDRPSRNEVMIEYIQKFNERHRMEAEIGVVGPREIAMLRRSKGEIEKPLLLKANDSIDVEMMPNSARRFRVYTDSVNFCMGSECHKLPLSKKRVNYIQAQWSEKSSAIEFRIMDADDGAYYFGELERLQQKKNKTK
jgi:hypothetical protein